MPKKPNAFIIAPTDALRGTGIPGISPIAKTGE